MNSAEPTQKGLQTILTAATKPITSTALGGSNMPDFNRIFTQYARENLDDALTAMLSANIEQQCANACSDFEHSLRFYLAITKL